MPYGSTLRGILGGQAFANVAAVVFDGANDYLTRGGGYTGAVDSKKLTLSFWIKDISVVAGNVFADRDVNYRLNVSNSNISFEAKGSGSFRLQFTHAYSFTSGQWHHVVMSFDLSNTGKRHVYINGVSQSITYSTYTNSTMDFTQADNYVGANAASGSAQDWLNAELAEAYLAFDQYIDLSVGSNLQKFRTTGGKPAFLGSDGSNPTGTSPTLFLSINSDDTASDFATNNGTGGGMTENGALTLATTSPSD